MGYRIKLLGVAMRTEGGIEARVNPGDGAARIPRSRRCRA